MNKKLGSQADSIFSKPAQEKQTPPTQTQGRGRPSKGGSLVKTTTVLDAELIYWLDSLSTEIKRNKGTSVSRSEIIRGFISSVIDSDLDFSNVTSEEDIKNTIKNRLR